MERKQTGRLLLVAWVMMLAVAFVALNPQTANAEAVVKSGEFTAAENEKNITWKLNDEGVLTISGEGEMKGFAESETPWKADESSIVKIVIEDGITNIGDNAFANCTALQNTVIPSSVTSIGNNIFGNCEKLEEIEFDDTKSKWEALINEKDLGIDLTKINVSCNPMKPVENFVVATNSFLWDALLLFLLCGTGIYFTLRLKFVQVTKFGTGMKRVFGGLKLFGAEADKDGMSSFQALATAVAAQIGTGNLAGAATAIVSGGPGAIFWMWLSAFFGMATIFAEATVAQKYKTKTEDGEITGGPAYYIKAAFNNNGFGKFLAALFSILIIFALGFIGNMVQSNEIGNAFQTAFNIPAWVVGLLLAVVAGFIFIGGIKRIASFTEKVVPFMAVIYIVGAVAVLCMNFNKIGYAFQQIFVCAFKPESLLGAALGVTVQKAMRFGVARGLFSNEAGMGSTPHAHAVAKVDHPCEQGVAAMIGVFIDTFVVLTLTALVVIISGLNAVGGENQLKGIKLTQAAFSQYFGSFGNVFIAVCLLFFAFSTIIGWYFFGEANVKYLFGKKAIPVYAILVVAFVFIGSLQKVDLVWNLSDMFNGFMVIPNLIGLIMLSGGVSLLYNEYEKRRANK